MRLVFSLCLCIQLYKYACNVSQIWMFLPVALESWFKNPLCTLQQHNFWQTLRLDYPASECVPQRRIQNPKRPHLVKLLSLGTMHLSLFVIGDTIHCKSSFMISALQRLWTWNVRLVGMSLDMVLCCDIICTSELSSWAAMVSYISFVINFVANHQNVGLVQWGNTCWQKLRCQC
jgi:hypothetical protein